MKSKKNQLGSKLLTFHLRAHCVELLEPSIRAKHKLKKNATHQKMIPTPDYELEVACLPKLSGIKELCILTVPAVDFEDKKVLCFKRDNPKSPTCKFCEIKRKQNSNHSTSEQTSKLVSQVNT